MKRGPWTPEEDEALVQYINKNGPGSWRALPKLAGELSAKRFFTINLFACGFVCFKLMPQRTEKILKYECVARGLK